MAVPALRPFSLGDPLPAGITVLEASAGTGKTFAITALAVRYIAEGHRPDGLLLMTFTIAATSELRERLRVGLVDARDRLVDIGSGQRLAGGDELVAALCAAPPGEVRVRATRLAQAVANFDAVTVATTHGFCLQVLRGLGVAGDLDADAALVDDLEALVDEVVDDIYLREFSHGRALPFDHATARLVGHAAALRQTFAELAPYPPEPVSVADCRVAFAAEVRAEVQRRTRRAGLLGFDDLQRRLRDVLISAPHGAAVAARLRERFPVVLIDEFQDTDPVQFQIVQEAFAAPGTTLVMIGDPKQAIYGFRGADVNAYLQAARAATDRRSMNVSWRSDAALLRACDALFGDARLGHPEIVYRPLEAAAHPVHERPRGLPDRAPLRIRVLERRRLAAADLFRGRVLAARARELVAADLAADIVRLLGADNDLTPGQIAVLVRKRDHGVGIRRALRAAGVPAVISRIGSVFETDVATEWLRLLDGLDRASSRTAVAAAALTVFCGWSAERVATADDAAWEDLHETLAGWAALLRHQGVAALLSAIAAGEGLYARVLARPDGERMLTDLRHIGELLQTAAMAHDLQAGGLGGWLSEQIRSADADDDSDERSRRLESDAAAVQVLTIHAAKGLEFPVVYCPYLWEEGWIPSARHSGAFPVYHTPHGARMLVVGGPDADGYQDDWRRSRDEQRGEELRLLYVAMTRARHQLVIWWAATAAAADSPLGRLLFSRDPDGTVPPTGARLPEDEAAIGQLEALARHAAGGIAVERAPASSDGGWSAATSGGGDVRVSALGRVLDHRWRRTSYSAITAAAHVLPRPAPDGVRGVMHDEPLPPDGAILADIPRPDPGFPDRALPLGAMPAGATVGTLVHQVLEDADFAAADPIGEIAALVARESARHRLELGDPVHVAEGLAAALATPWGADFGDASLAGVARRDRLDEMAFEIPLSGGDAPHAGVDVRRIGELLLARVPATDPLHRYARRLVGAPFAGTVLRGFLNGFIDLVVRLPETAGGGLAVVDYKTNRLGAGVLPPTAWDYRPSAVAEAMEAADYPLQALLYLVALHRYLRWRMPGRDPDRQMRGVAYLFVRGMVGADAPAWEGGVSGVWTWQPPPGLVAALSDLLDEGAP